MNKLTILTMLAVLAMAVGVADISANDIDVYNVKIQNYRQNGASFNTSSTLDISFDLSWSNYNSGLQDANEQTYFDRAWVFVKFYDLDDTAAVWQHAILTTGGSVGAYSDAAGTGIAFDIGDDSTAADYGLPTTSTDTRGRGRGAFCKPGTNQTLRWAIGKQDGFDPTHRYKVRVHAIEMVYIPEGPFYIGDGATPNRYVQDSSHHSNPLKVTAEGSALTVYYRYYSAGWKTGNNSLSSAFPKGYGGFYIMKYEMSEQQYVDFLNTLIRCQQDEKNPNTGYRSGISYTTGDTLLNFSTTTPHQACHNIDWADVASYADWACLRPMTELEYEKACRGGSDANNIVGNEHAWGSTSVTQATGISEENTSKETATPTTANCVYEDHASVQGPLRCGWAATSSSSRLKAGSSYYGVMELSGNLVEPTACSSCGGTYKGTHGDAILVVLDTTYSGNATNKDWPGINLSYPDRGVHKIGDLKTRGGSWRRNELETHVSNRDTAEGTCDSKGVEGGGRQLGGRYARTKPLP